MLTTGPSLHLSWKEMACKDGTSYPTEWRTNRAIILAELFELIRSLCGNKPIKILSAYRTSEHNKKVKGARFSQHMQGRALDLKPPEEMNITHFYSIIKDIPNTTALRGLGKYPTFVHIDIRPTEKRKMWG